MEGNKVFKPYNRNLDAIFTDDDNKGKYKYTIPDFQRQYSWTNKHLEEFWKDLIEASTNKEECYFMGSFVLVEEQQRDVKVYSLIDGQQRFTTFVIMAYVLLYDFSDRLNEKTIYKLKDYLQLGNNNMAFTLQNNPDYNSIFDECIRMKNTFKHDDIIITDKELKEDTPKYKYLNSAYFFYNHFDEYRGDLNTLVNYIFNNIYVIKTICYDENFAIKMFISLNDRGLPLSNADNFKSWLYSKCDVNYRESFNREWKSIVATANKLHVYMDDFIVWYEYFLLRSNPKLSVLDELKEKLKNRDVSEIIIDLTKFMSCVETMFSPKENANLIYSLLYVRWGAYIKSAIISSLMVDYKDKNALYKQMRRFYYIALVAGDNVNSVKNTSFKLIDYIVNNNSIDDIKELIDDYVYRRDRISKVYRNINGDVYGEDFLKPLMLSVDYSLREDGSVTLEQLEKIHMDHILPQAYQSDKNEEWKYIRNHKVIESCINSIGNMALLQWYKNIKALNKGFEKKLYYYSGYEEDGVTLIDEEKGKGVTRFFTTQEIINEYKDKEKKWTSESIATRKKTMIGRIEKMLSISEEDKEIDFDKDRSGSKSGKWLYKEKKYNNKQFVRQVLTDYINDNNIKKIESIPDEIAKYRLYSRDFISDKDDNYRYKIEINGLKLYLCDVYYTSETPKIVELIKKHYNFEYEFLEDTNQKEQQKIAEEVLEKINNTFKEKYSFVVVNSNKLKSYIQFADKKWLNDKMHFEIYTNTADWNNKNIKGKIELHFEKSKSGYYVDFLNKNGFDIDKTLTPGTSVGKYENKLISENVVIDCTDEYALDDTIDSITTILVELIEKYGYLIDDIANKYDLVSSDLSKSERERFIFWTEFVKELERQNEPFPLRTISTHNWYDISIGTSKAYLTIDLVNKSNHIKVGLYVSKENKDFYDMIITKKNMIEKDLNLSLEWVDETEYKASRAYYIINGLDFDDHSNYNELISKTIDIASRMAKVFAKYVE